MQASGQSVRDYNQSNPKKGSKRSLVLTAEDKVERQGKENPARAELRMIWRRGKARLESKAFFVLEEKEGYSRIS